MKDEKPKEINKIKKCKGFDHFICYCCKRCDNSHDVTLIKKLVYYEADKAYNCKYHVGLRELIY